MTGRNLRNLKPGDRGRIIRVEGKGAIKRRILDMGIIPGLEVELERFAPLGDPIEIKLRGYHLSLRQKEAERIVLEEKIE